MQSRNKLAYLGALTLLFSYAELLFPRITPFFKPGLSNAIIIFSLTFDFPSFIILCLIKSLAASLTAGTLFSPFLIISVAQSVTSGLLMFATNKIFHKKIISAYGISMIGSVSSAIVQIFLCSVYLGRGTLNLLAPMMIFSLFSGILTAFIYEQFSQDFEAGLNKNHQESTEEQSVWKKSSIVKIMILVIFSVLIFIVNNIIFLSFALILSLFLQKKSKRRILILPHLFLWIFVFLSQMFIPGGKVLFRVWKFSVTDTSLIIALAKSLRLSAVIALSQCMAFVSFPKDTLLGMTLGIFSEMSAKMQSAELKNLPIPEKIRAVIRGSQEAPAATKS